MSLANTRDPNSLSSKFRQKRNVRLREIIDKIYAENKKTRIVDIGGNLAYWERVGIQFLKDRNIEITIVNIEKNELQDNKSISEIFRFVVADGTNLHQFEDDQFHLAHSNSVMEHVGNWSNMRNFAAENCRISEYQYMQTPYYWFFVDPHFYKFPFFHWLPMPIRTFLLQNLSLAYRGKIPDFGQARLAVESSILLTGKEVRYLFPNSNIKFERFLGFKKPIIVYTQPEESKL